MPERYGKLHLNDYAGHRSITIIIIDETPKKYRIRTTDNNAIRLAGRNRYLYPGQTALVPKTAVTIDSDRNE